MAVAWHLVISVNPPLYGVSIAPKVVGGSDCGCALAGEGPYFGGKLNLDEISPVLFLGGNVYLTTSKDTVRNLNREVYGKR